MKVIKENIPFIVVGILSIALIVLCIFAVKDTINSREELKNRPPVFVETEMSDGRIFATVERYKLITWLSARKEITVESVIQLSPYESLVIYRKPVEKKP